MQLTDLVNYLDDFLEIGAISDKSHNGLQVEANTEVATVVGAVDACLAVYEQAAELGAELIFVHHGESWGGNMSRLTGRLAERIGFLFRNEISLYAAHLPLDAHAGVGHNARIAAELGLLDRQAFAEYAGALIGIRGHLPAPLSTAALVEKLNTVLTTECQVLDFRQQPICKIGVISGAGAGALTECAALGLDCLITGEFGHTEYHVAKELQSVVLIAAGHYRTEVPGVVAVLNLLQQRFSLRCEFVDVPTGL